MGMSFKQIAIEHDLSRQTVAKVWRKYELNCGADAVTPEQLMDRIKRKSYDAVEAALDDPTDNYKRGNMGAKVLSGIGEFQSGDHINVQINTVVGSLPDEWKGRYLSTDDVIDVEAEDA